MKTIDNLYEKFGMQKVRLGSQDQKVHKMKQERLSKRYSTKLSDCITVKV